jgi:flagellar hook assembly protein FlgD
MELQGSSFSLDKGESAEIKVILPEAGIIEIRVFDSSGKSVRLLADGRYGPGPARFRFNGKSDTGQQLGIGTYYARVMTRWFSRVEALEALP